MKVSEFKKLEEGFFSDLVKIGSDAASFAKSQSGTRSRRMTKAEYEKQRAEMLPRIQKGYLQDFIEDFIVDLDAAIKRKTIDLKATGIPVPQTTPVDREKELTGIADLGYNEGYNSFLNALVENYINEQTTESLSSWIMRWFTAYMKGVNWTNEKTNVETIAKEIESSYSKDRGKAAIQKLASKSWDLVSKAKYKLPSGAQDVLKT